MSDPLALFPFAIAAGGGHIDGLDTARLVAAGVTLLQRSAPLVRALSGKRSAIFLPPGPAFITALAASDGRGAVLLSDEMTTAQIAERLAQYRVGAVFTDDARSNRLPLPMPKVLLDASPIRSQVIIDDRARDIDLGSHYGLSLEGSRDTAGSDDECLIAEEKLEPSTAIMWTHRMLLDATRLAAGTLGVTPMHRLSVVGPWSDIPTFIATGAAPLYYGAQLTTRA